MRCALVSVFVSGWLMGWGCQAVLFDCMGCVVEVAGVFCRMCVLSDVVSC